jgi:predicted dehydrogenase
MGKAHTNALKTLPYMVYPPPARPRLVALAGRDRAGVEHAAMRYGYASAYTDWRDLVADPAVSLVDNGGPNHVHAEPCIAAAEVGKHVLCEKPLARTAAEARSMLDAVARTHVTHMVGFNYRFAPAVRYAHELIHSGKLGTIYHFRARYLQDWLADPGTPIAGD